MDCKKVIKQLLIERGLTVSDLAEALNMQPQSLRNKLNRNSYSVADFVAMLDALDADLIAVARGSGQTFRG